MNVVHQQQSVSLPLLIVEGAGPTLLGRNWLSKIKLDWPSICYVKSPDLRLDDILKESEDLFSGRLGKCSELTASLELKPDAKPVFRRPYTPPYTCKKAIEKEVDKLHQQGVIEPVTHSDWATPVCVAPKPDGSIRLCGDYSQTVNPRIKVDQYPLPEPQDIFSTLNGGKFFAKLDLSQAYLQVPLDAEGQEITTITTHKGLFRMLRMPYGIASAPAVFQALVDNLLAGLEGYQCTSMTHSSQPRPASSSWSALLRSLPSSDPRDCSSSARSVSSVQNLLSTSGTEWMLPVSMPQKTRFRRSSRPYAQHPKLSSVRSWGLSTSMEGL